EGIPIFLGAMHQTLPPVLERYPLQDMQEGDIYVSNDPFTGNGTHKNDVNILKPIFWEGEPVFFAATKAHWTDIGGKDPGSWSPDATNTYQEGVTVPPLRLYRAGVLNEELKEVILASTRMRENNEGDLMAQISACHTAEVRVHELLRTYGIELTNACIDSHFDYLEAKVRAEIEKLPDGTYTGEDLVDTDGVSEEPVKIVVHVTIDGSDITFDFSDCETQRFGGSGNAHLVNTVASCRVAMKCLLAPHETANEGFYRPMRVITREGTVTHPVHPAPGTVWDNVGRAIIESVLFALAPVVPERSIGGIFGGVQALAMAGIDPRAGVPFIHVMPYAGGWGARETKDGVSALCTILNGDNDNIPCEVSEAKYPLLVERYELIPDSGGAGRTRGGLGVVTEYRILSDGAMVSCGMGRSRFSPPGLFDGGDGMRSTLIIDDNDGPPRELPFCAGEIVQGNGLLSHRCGGGGGFGDPRERSPEAIVADVVDGYVTAEAAVRDYGLDPALLPGDQGAGA
ncbi:MAG: N-methylhydantoinase, partial [Solirubrobacteraceae bacterium]|nr:N-methylhydantoinase [Solirubrobacteraceae bacterium]